MQSSHEMGHGVLQLYIVNGSIQCMKSMMIDYLMTMYNTECRDTIAIIAIIAYEHMFFFPRKIHLSILLEKCTYRKQKETFHLASIVIQKLIPTSDETDDII